MFPPFRITAYVCNWLPNNFDTLLGASVFIFSVINSIFIFISSLLFLRVIYLNQTFFKKIKPWFYDLNLLRKIILINITITFFIPNKVWVHNNLNSWLFFIMLMIWFYLSLFIEPILWIFFFIFICLIIESIIFGYSYEKNLTFKKRIDYILFNNNETFARYYLEFFFGKMSKDGIQKAKKPH